jgi:hypothetical protein
MASATAAAYVNEQFSDQEASFLDEFGQLLTRFQGKGGGIPFTIVLSRPGVNLRVERGPTEDAHDIAQPRNYCWNGVAFVLC